MRLSEYQDRTSPSGILSKNAEALLLAGIICAVPLLLTTLLFLLQYRDYVRVRQWDQVAGQVQTVDKFSRPTLTLKSWKRETWWNFIYTYTVDGRVYENSRVALYGLDDNDLNELYLTLRENSAVTVWYDHDHPASAVLIPGFDARSYRKGFVLGLGFLAAGVLLSWVAIKRREMVQWIH